MTNAPKTFYACPREEIVYVDSICIWVSSVRRTDFHTGEMRYQKYRFQCSYGDPYHYCTYFFFMDHGISGRGTTRHRKCFCQNLDISDPVRTLPPVLPGCATSVHCRSEMWIRWSRSINRVPSSPFFSLFSSCMRASAH